MARASRPTGDKATNARRRYYRSAERYLKQAQNAVGAYAAKARALAQIQLENALKTYSKNTTQSFAKPIQRVANALGVDLNQKRQEIKQRTDVHKSLLSLGNNGSFSKIESISHPIRPIMGELISVVTKVPSPILWNDAYVIVDQSKS